MFCLFSKKNSICIFILIQEGIIVYYRYVYFKFSQNTIILTFSKSVCPFKTK